MLQLKGGAIELAPRNWALASTAPLRDVSILDMPDTNYEKHSVNRHEGFRVVQGFLQILVVLL